VRSGRHCKKHKKNDPAPYIHPKRRGKPGPKKGKKKKRKYTNSGDWEKIYLEELALGHEKGSAAAKANVHVTTPKKLGERDPAFAEREEIAYQKGTAYLLDIADRRINDPDRPADSILKQRLAHRGISEKKKMEISGPEGGPITTQALPIPVELLPLSLRRALLKAVEEVVDSGQYQLPGKKEGGVIDAEYEEVK
jgi:hypothetical protein